MKNNNNNKQHLGNRSKSILRCNAVFQLCVLTWGIFMLSACTKKQFIAVPVSSIMQLNDTLFKVGDTLKISGVNFSTTPGQNLVSIASIALNVVSATPTQLIAIIPATAQSGQLTIAYPNGQSVSYPSKIHILVTGQPFIRAITPASFQPGDTVLLHGSNFGTPVTLNGLTFGGTLVNIYNVTDTLIKVIVPNNALSGAAIITTNGLSSPPVQITVNQPNPLTDGRLYWMIGTHSNVNQNGATDMSLYRGNDQDVAPYCSIIASSPAGTLATTEITQPQKGTSAPGNIYDLVAPARYDVSNIVTDGNGNWYYLYISTRVGTTYTFSLVRVTVNPAYTHTIIWSKVYTATGTGSPGTTIFKDPLGTNQTITNYPMSRLAIDGNNIYIKMGLTNTYFIGDVSQPVFSPTLQTYSLPDANTYNMEFGKNYIFYGVIGSSSHLRPDIINEIHYMQRGSGKSTKIPLDPTQSIVTYMTDPSHNDVLLIYTVAPYYGSFTGYLYEFNANTGTLTKLYDLNNWADAYSPVTVIAAYGTSTGCDLNLGFVWVKNHIYYVNMRRLLNNSLATAIYRLSDDGSSSKSTNIYASVDQNALGVTYGSFVPLFIDKTQAKP